MNQRQRFCKEEEPLYDLSEEDFLDPYLNIEDHMPRDICKCNCLVLEPYDVCKYHFELASKEALEFLYKNI